MSAALMKRSGPSPLDALRSLVSDDLQKVDTLIFGLISSKTELIPEISAHTITSGGKRLRPILTLVTSKMCGYEGSAHIDLAASVEFIHTATLLHDDVVDKSDLRRGTVTANNLWGNKESILVGDFLLGKAFQLMGSASSLEVYRVLSKAAVVISEGEVKQLSLTGKIDVSMEEYFEVINAKTAELFAAACAIGGIIAGRNETQVQALASYGMNLGSAFQIVDDALDYSANSDGFGKNIGDDFREKKVTLPVIIAYSESSEKQKEFWQNAFAENTEYSDGLLSEALQIMNSIDAVGKTIKIASDMTINACNSLKIFPDSPLKQALLNVLEFVVSRGF